MSIKWILPLDMRERAEALSPRIQELEQELNDLRKQQSKLNGAFNHLSAFIYYHSKPMDFVITDYEMENKEMIVDINAFVHTLAFHGYDNVPQIEAIESGNYHLTWGVIDNNVEFTFEEIENV